MCPHCYRYFKEILDQNALCDMVILTANGKWKPFQEEGKQQNKKRRPKVQHVYQKEIPEALEMEAAVTSSPLTSRLSQTIVLDSDPEDSLTTTPHNRSRLNEGRYSIYMCKFIYLHARKRTRLC